MTFLYIPVTQKGNLRLRQTYGFPWTFPLRQTYGSPWTFPLRQTYGSPWTFPLRQTYGFPWTFPLGGCRGGPPSPLCVEPIRIMKLLIYRLVRIISRSRKTTSARLFVIFSRISAFLFASTFLHTSIYGIWWIANFVIGIHCSGKKNGWIGKHCARCTAILFILFFAFGAPHLTIYFFACSFFGSRFIIFSCWHLYYIIT